MRREPNLYRMGAEIVAVTPQGRILQIEPLDARALLHFVERRYRFIRDDGKPIWQLPRELGEYVRSQYAAEFREITRAVTHPVFTEAGEWLAGSLYHEEARVLVRAPGDWPEVPSSPTEEEVTQAYHLLRDELLGDFPLLEEADVAHVLALLIALQGRLLIDGQLPMFVVSAPTPGSGKTLLSRTVVSLITGEEPGIMVFPSSDDELRKRVVAILRKGQQVLVFDNVHRTIDSPVLAALLTTGRLEDRKLGETTMLDLPHTGLIIANGNAMRLSNEITRRSVPINLNPNVERPHERTGFRHERLLEWVAQNRPMLTCAVATLISNWLAKGRPRPTQIKVSAFGGFEGFYKVVGGVLEAAGIPGFLGNLEALRTVGNEEARELKAFVESWAEAFGTSSVTTADLWFLANKRELWLTTRGAGNELSQKTRMGKALDRLAGRIVGGFRLDNGGMDLSRKVRQWKLVRLKATKPTPKRRRRKK